MKIECFKEKNSEIVFARLASGVELFTGITELCQQLDVKYGSIISCIGSFTELVYTYPKVDQNNALGIGFQDPLHYKKLCEVISGQGTIGLNKDGNREIHIHAIMCDTNGKHLAGHLMPGCIIAATIELSIAIAKSGTIIRSIDSDIKLPLFKYKA
jgi:predicted DNA-binding protein with PD1-like motif